MDGAAQGTVSRKPKSISRVDDCDLIITCISNICIHHSGRQIVEHGTGGQFRAEITRSTCALSGCSNALAAQGATSFVRWKCIKKGVAEASKYQQT